MSLPLVKLFASSFPANRARISSEYSLIGDFQGRPVRASDALAGLEERADSCVFSGYSAHSEYGLPYPVIRLYVADSDDRVWLQWNGSPPDFRLIRFDVPESLRIPSMADYIALMETEWIEFSMVAFSYSNEVTIDAKSFDKLVDGKESTDAWNRTVYSYSFKGKIAR